MLDEILNKKDLKSDALHIGCWLLKIACMMAY